MKPTSLRSTIYIGNLAESPLGPIWIAVSDQGLVAVYIGTNRDTFAQSVEKMGFSDFAIDPERTASVLEQISEYLEGERQIFDMPIDWSVMTPFQQQALRATLAIPYGQVTAYGDLARQLGKPRAARAVGRAQATNPMPLVIPCHRVIGSDGGLHGYGAGDGLETKAWLLHLEGASLG